MQYRILENDVVLNTIDQVIDYCIEEDYHDEDDYGFEEWVNDQYGYISIGDKRYYAYDILQTFEDSDLVIEEYQEYCNDDDENEARFALRNADTGEEIHIQRYTVRVEDDDNGDTDGDQVAVDPEDYVVREEPVLDTAAWEELDEEDMKVLEPGDVDYLMKARETIVNNAKAEAEELQNTEETKQNYAELFQRIGD